MEANEPTKSLQNIGNRYLEEYTRGVQRYLNFLNDSSNRAGAKPFTPVEQAELQRRYADFLVREAPQFWGRFAEAGLGYYTTLANTGIEVANRYLDEVLGVDGVPGDQCSDDGKAEEQSALVFHGVRGESASNAFLVTNNRNAAIEVSFDIAEVVSADGQTHFTPEVEFEPKQCSLGPQAKRVVQCSLVLGDDFTAGQSYRGSIQVVGFPGMATPIMVEVEEPAIKPANPPRAKSKQRPKKKTAVRKKSAPKRRP